MDADEDDGAVVDLERECSSSDRASGYVLDDASPTLIDEWYDSKCPRARQQPCWASRRQANDLDSRLVHVRALVWGVGWEGRIVYA